MIVKCPRKFYSNYCTVVKEVMASQPNEQKLSSAFPLEYTSSTSAVPSRPDSAYG